MRGLRRKEVELSLSTASVLLRRLKNYAEKSNCIDTTADHNSRTCDCKPTTQNHAASSYWLIPSGEIAYNAG
jgi:hypothetical protein